MPIAEATFPEWLVQAPPFLRAVGIFLFTFASEDAATVTAALLTQSGSMSFTLAFTAAVLGIWFSDAGLYVVGRLAGPPVLEHRWLQRFVKPARVMAAEQWFARQGIWLLVSSRFVPGTRLPTYLAAGLLKLPFPRFLLITGVAAILWTLGVFAVIGFFGEDLLQFIERWHLGGFGIVLIVIAMVLLGKLVLKLLGKLLIRDAGNYRPPWRWCIDAWWKRWTRWEFWPAWLFYPPVVLHALWLMVRHRSITVPTHANPGIFSGGLIGESKLTTLRQLSAVATEFTAVAHAIEPGDEPEILRQLRQLTSGGRLQFPIILKPDVGQRGIGVKLVRDEAQALAYCRSAATTLVAQAYVEAPHEVGVFYYRFPHETHGRIFAITEKVFPTVTGDGVRTVAELIWSDERARVIAGRYLERLAARADEVLPADETLRLVEAGNHAQGCIFRDGERFRTPELEARIDDISRRVEGFFIGRYDLRYAEETDLRAGCNFKIIELNGAASEATNIYDARNSLWTAYRILFRQWALVFAIGSANRARGSTGASAWSVWRESRRCAKVWASLPAAD